MKRLQEEASFLRAEMFGFWWRTKKRAGEICSVFDIGDFCQVFNQVIYFEINR